MAYHRDRRSSFLARIVALGFCIVFPLSAGQKPPEFYFGGHSLNVGMSESDALAAISACCTLVPPVNPWDEAESGSTGMVGGHFIRPKEGPPYGFLGSIFFQNRRVSRITRPLDENFDGYNDDVVRVARALYRAVAPTTGDSSVTVSLSVQHVRMTNAEEDILSLSFPNGREIELQVVTLDNPDKTTKKRDAVTLDEVLEAPQPLPPPRVW